jgi:hypothetical protein
MHTSVALQLLEARQSQMCEILQNMREKLNTMYNLLRRMADTPLKKQNASATDTSATSRVQGNTKRNINGVIGKNGRAWIMRAIAFLLTTGSISRRNAISRAWQMYLNEHPGEKATLSELQVHTITCARRLILCKLAETDTYDCFINYVKSLRKKVTTKPF